MWEDAIPQIVKEEQDPAGRAEKQRPRRTKTDDNLVLWVQLLLCGLAVAGAVCAKQMQLPVLPWLRTTFTAAMQAPGPQFFTEERNFAKFTQETAAAAREVLGELTTARTPHKAPAKSAPAGSSLESYTPEFGALCFPLQSSGGTYNSTYGWRIDPITGQGQDFHTGVDLAAAQGEPISAAGPGVVRYAGTHASYGNYVRILHADGDETIYAHMQYLFVRTGQSVRAGQALGTVGDTGNATGPHLHFELLHKGVRYDPTQALQAA